MSELTLCNFCVLRSIKQRHGEEQVTTLADGYGWIEVLVDGQRVATLMALTDHCVC